MELLRIEMDQVYEGAGGRLECNAGEPSERYEFMFNAHEMRQLANGAAIIRPFRCSHGRVHWFEVQVEPIKAQLELAMAKLPWPLSCLWWRKN